MAIPETPSQDHYQHGFDVIRILSGEFGSSPDYIRRQVTHGATTIEIEGALYTGDKLFIPVDKAQGKFVAVMGPDRQWRMRFPQISE